MIGKHVLIGGGTGFIGSHLQQLLKQKGYDVTIVSRMPGLRRITWHELTENGVPENVTDIVNLAGQNVLDPTRRWTPGFKQNVWNSRINSALAMNKVIEKSKKINTFINISGVSLYRPNDQKIYTENDPGEEFDFMSKLCIEWEKAATIPNNYNCRNIKIRSGVVIGRDGGMIHKIWLPFWLGLGGPMGKGNQILPWIHINDLCNMILFCIDNKNVNGILNGVAPEIITNAQFSKIFASTLYRPAIFPIPEFVVNLLFGKERSVLLLTGPKIKPKKPLEFGYNFKYPTVRSACEEIVNKA